MGTQTLTHFGEYGAEFLGALLMAWLIYRLISWMAKRDGSNPRETGLWAFWITIVLMFFTRLGTTRSIISAVVFGILPPLILYANDKKRKVPQ